MWLSQRKVLWMFKPRFLAELTLFSTFPWMVYLYCSVVLLVVICRTSHLSGLNRIRYWFSHFCIVPRSYCRVHCDLIFQYRKQSSAKSGGRFHYCRSWTGFTFSAKATFVEARPISFSVVKGEGTLQRNTSEFRLLDSKLGCNWSPKLGAHHLQLLQDCPVLLVPRRHLWRTWKEFIT
jgi:hypothetical protein